ncbi:MAG TPA: molybdate ABC transporter substrate-binding protein, partial [Caulobacteraceae bacterium]|nr:molybdate ABC transporter substrate-binding protein [Caulobacteraceae bacterium]
MAAKTQPRTLLSRRATLAGIAALPSFAWGQNEPLITVFADISLKDALNKAGFIYVAQTLHPVRFSYGTSSALARQIEQGAPADVFISADIDWMDYLAKKQLIVASTRRNLVSNHLALIAGVKSKVSLRIGSKMPILRALGDRRLAMEGPDAPSGRYGQAALTKLGVWEQLKDHLAPAENVRAALNSVANGEAPLGIVYDTDAKGERGVRIVGLFADSDHAPIVYTGAVLKASSNANATNFLEALTSPLEAKAIRGFGFRI